MYKGNIWVSTRWVSSFWWLPSLYDLSVIRLQTDSLSYAYCCTEAIVDGENWNPFAVHLNEKIGSLQCITEHSSFANVCLDSEVGFCSDCGSKHLATPYCIWGAVWAVPERFLHQTSLFVCTVAHQLETDYLWIFDVCFLQRVKITIDVFRFSIPDFLDYLLSCRINGSRAVCDWHACMIDLFGRIIADFFLRGRKVLVK